MDTAPSPSDQADLAERFLEAAKAAGAESADVIVAEGQALSIETRAGALEQAERAEGVDLGLRVIMGKRQACVAISDAAPQSLAMAAERAVAMAREAPEDPHIGLASPDELAEDPDIAGLDLEDFGSSQTPDQLQDAALSAEAAALAVTGISKVESAGASYARRHVHLAATNGFSAGYGRSGFSLSCVAITGEGTEMERDYYGDGRVYLSELESAEEIGRKAAERTLERAGARKPPTGHFPVLYDERVASGLIGHLLSAANGSAVARGSSWLRDRLGERVLPAELSITEDPLRPRVSGSRPFDAEGLATRRREVVQNGVLTGWTLDLTTARKLGMRSTGNANRAPSSPPSPGLTNIALTQGSASRDDLIGQMGTGLLVTSLIGATINPTTGDYSRGASGLWVENGQISHAVNECTIAGNLLDMLKSVTPANDARTHRGYVVPSLLVEGLTIAGS
ncbi:MAG: TldD/PmbA family protein [Pseudomonadota bacterium]